MLEKWTEEVVLDLFDSAYFELVHRAYNVHQQNFTEHDFELCTLLNIKTGACPEDCAYCPQSGHYQTGLKKEPLLDIDFVIANAKSALLNGAKRFCMGAAWKNPPRKDFYKVIEMIKAVKALGLQTCVTLGALDQEQVAALKAAGLDYYNHNLDTSPNFYKEIITTRTFEERLETIDYISEAAINLCCGGILGMGETRLDRAQFLMALAQLPATPKSIPINKLITIPGTPLEHAKELDHFEFVKTIAITRVMFPHSYIRLSAGREGMSDAEQAWCYMAGANSIFIGDKLLTAANPALDKDVVLFDKLNLPHQMKSDRMNQCC